MDVTGPTDAKAHVAAVDAALDALGLQDRPTIVAGHSMGGVLAIRRAAAHRDRSGGLALGAPLYGSGAEADAAHRAMGGWRPCWPVTGHSRAPSALGCAGSAAWRLGSPSPTARIYRFRWIGQGSSTRGHLLRRWTDSSATTARFPPSMACIGSRLPSRSASVIPCRYPGGRPSSRARPALGSVVHPWASQGLLTDPAWCRQLIWEALRQGDHSGPDLST